MAVYNNLAGRNVQRRLHQYTYVGVHNNLAKRNVDFRLLASVAVYNSLVGRNVQHVLINAALFL